MKKRILPPSKELVFNDYRRKWLRLLSGAQGKTPGDPPIVSMGSQSPPYVDQPIRPIDWLKSDGAQVTRPSIDPYRELVETSILLLRGRARLSMPLGLDVDNWELDGGTIRSAISSVYRMGVALYTRRADVVDLVGGLSITNPFTLAPLEIIRDKPVGFLLAATISREQLRGEEDKLGVPTYVEIPSNKLEVKKLVDGLHDIALKVDGILVNEDLDEADEYLEVSVSLIDTELRKRRVGFSSLRERMDIIAKSSVVRGADDVFKLMALGADLVVVDKLAEIGVGLDEKTRRLTGELISERLEYLLVGLQREIKLLAGAAGVSSLHTTLRSNRELLRCLDLPDEITNQLRVKHAGVIRL
jgi:hypothetical protein